MRLFFSLLILIALLSGCGQQADQPVYDTKANTENFPAIALTLVDELEAGTLVDYDRIIMRFADLYTEQSDLLDSKEWKDVIGRLGDKFKLKADEALAKGLAGFDRASAYYLLAAFADPADKKLGEKGRLFSAWQVESKAGPESLVAKLPEMTLSDRVGLLKKFELGDSLSRAFSEHYLRENILERAAAGLTETELAELSDTELALLNYTGLTDRRPSELLAEWDKPSIGLIASNIFSLGDGWYRAELFFETKENIVGVFTVALEVAAEDSRDKYLTFDFDPVLVTSSWRVGNIVATAKNIYFDAPLGEIRVGFYLRSNRAASQAKLIGSDQQLFSLELPQSDR